MWYCNQYIHHQISSMFLTWAHLCGSLHRGGQAPGIQFRVPGYIGTLKWRRAKCYWSFSTIHKHDPDVGWRITTTYVTPHFLSQCFLRSREHHIYYDEWAHPSPYLPFQWREASVRTAFWLSIESGDDADTAPQPSNIGIWRLTLTSVYRDWSTMRKTTSVRSWGPATESLGEFFEDLLALLFTKKIKEVFAPHWTSRDSFDRCSIRSIVLLFLEGLIGTSLTAKWVEFYVG